MSAVMPISRDDLSLLLDDMRVFRDAGCRLVVPSYSREGFLVSRLDRNVNLPASRDNLIIAPFGFGSLDADIYSELISDPSTRAEIAKPLFFLTPEKIVSIGSLDYVIYPTSQSLDRAGSLVYNKPRYLVTFDDMKNIGVVYPVESLSLH